MRILWSIAISAFCVACSVGAAENTSQTQSSICPQTRMVTIHTLPAHLDFAGDTVPTNWGYVREAIEREVLTTSCMHTSTTYALCRASRYFPIIEPILAKNGIPEDFKYLCVAESGLNEGAYSPARAAGLWQFIASTAQSEGLEVNGSVDERYNIELATEAACRYLKSAYDLFGNWSLVAASYNAGRTGVTKRLKIQGVSDYWDLFLPEETMRYVPRILSFKILMNNPEHYGFGLGKEDHLDPFSNYEVIEVSDAKIVWSELAAKYGSTYRQLRILNPWIRDYEHNNPSQKVYKVKMATAEFKDGAW